MYLPTGFFNKLSKHKEPNANTIPIKRTSTLINDACESLNFKTIFYDVTLLEHILYKGKLELKLIRLLYDKIYHFTELKNINSVLPKK